VLVNEALDADNAAVVVIARVIGGTTRGGWRMRPDPRIGTDLGPYRIEALLGRGGMGQVYLAEEIRLGRKVALKILPPELAEDEAFRARFERESRMAAAIDDPNVLPVYEAGEIEGLLFLAMRYVDGTDLERRLAAGPLTPREVVRLLGQAASALDAAHARGLVHRDVKPANILIARTQGDERGDHVYLADFGLTRRRDEATALTRAGTLMGTLDYMAPEQMEGRAIDGAADQYALAAIAFRALTGQVPFARGTEVAVITAHLKDPPPSAVALNPTLPEAVDRVLARGMAKSATDRYPSCAALMAALRQVLGVSTVETAGPAPARGGRRRAAAVVAAVAMAVLLLVGGAWLALGRGGPAASPSPGPSGSAVAAAPSSASPSASPTAGTFPNDAEATLLAALPASMRPTCQRGPYDLVSGDASNGTMPVASLRCTPDISTGANLVVARQFRSTGLSAGNGAFTTDSAVSGIEAPNGIRPGDCATSPQAGGRWTRSGADAGAIACFVEAKTGDAQLWWSYKDRRLLVVATNQRGDSAALYTFFENVARFISP
jgi:hypothetical protein